MFHEVAGAVPSVSEFRVLRALIEMQRQSPDTPATEVSIAEFIRTKRPDKAYGTVRVLCKLEKLAQQGLATASDDALGTDARRHPQRCYASTSGGSALFQIIWESSEPQFAAHQAWFDADDLVEA